MRRVLGVSTFLLLLCFASPALAAPAPFIEQAETFSVQNANPNVIKVTDSAASPSGGTNNAFRYAANGRINKTITVEGSNLSLSVRSRTNGAGPFTQRVIVDGVVVDTRTFGTNSVLTTYAERARDIPLTPGTHTISVGADTDLGPGERLFVDYVRVSGTPPVAEFNCEGIDIREGANVADVINNAPPGSTFCQYAGTYPVTSQINMQNGDVWRGEPGTTDPVGPASTVDAKVELTNPDPEGSARSVNRMVNATEGANFTIDWIGMTSDPSAYRTAAEQGTNCINPGPDYCPAGGTGTIIGFGQSGPDVTLTHLELRNAPSNCAIGLKGKLLDSELYNCSTDINYVGFQSGATKSNFEAEYGRNFVHDNAANGIWCDQGCNNVPARENGFWTHDNVLVNNGRFGMRFEYSPVQNPGDAPVTDVTALSEGNIYAGNGLSDGSQLGAGTSSADVQNVLYRNNSFGGTTLAGVPYGGNENGRGIQFSDPPTRTDMYNAEATANNMNGESIIINSVVNPNGCYTDPPFNDRGVFCHDNVR